MIGELNNMESFLVMDKPMYKSMKVAYIETTTIHRYERSNTHAGELLALQSGALIISAYRDFLPSHPIPIPLIAFEHLSLSMVI